MKKRKNVCVGENVFRSVIKQPLGTREKGGIGRTAKRRGERVSGKGG